MYSIKAITSLTGLTAETLRAWERRYACIMPARNSTGRRFYSQQDLEKLTLLVNLTRKGHPIGKLATLDNQQLQDFQKQVSVQPAKEQSPLLVQIIDSLKQYRIERCEQLLKKALIAAEPLDYARDILLPALQTVGELWHDGKLNIAQEHMFSSCIKRIVLSMVNNLHHHSKNNPGMLFATPSGDPHEFGILVSCLIAANQGYNCYYLGADLPAKDIIEACQHLKPDVIVMGLVKTPPEQVTLDELQLIIDSVSSEPTQVWLGGSGAYFYYTQLQNDLSHCELITDIDHFNAKAQQQQLSN
ncbi:MerR family transcriptional regulator [Methylomonas sp. LW13]|uniref:MerR family transcriptional regulator n=1 Tax=unclassified Methylomonas TaxID=2608980 RepID=UPI00051BC704|nr:MerR family transcriptional regulator [Methylomonas sp. LW13]QBC27073.1 MerR family transcriptional regulator [Methylomonas sp. LW13]